MSDLEPIPGSGPSEASPIGARARGGLLLLAIEVLARGGHPQAAAAARAALDVMRRGAGEAADAASAVRGSPSGLRTTTELAPAANASVPPPLRPSLLDACRQPGVVAAAEASLHVEQATRAAAAMRGTARRRLVAAIQPADAGRARQTTPLFDQWGDLAGWLGGDGHVYARGMEWLGFTAEGHAWRADGGGWVGRVAGGCVFDSVGRALAWSGVRDAAPITPWSRAFHPPRPTRPPRPQRPARRPLPPPPSRPAGLQSPPGGWSSMALGEAFGA